MKQLGGVVAGWARSNRMILDGFYQAMLAAAKRNSDGVLTQPG